MFTLTPDQQDEVKKWIRSAAGAMIAAAGMALVNAFVHAIPAVMTYLAAIGGAYVAHGNTQ